MNESRFGSRMVGRGPRWNAVEQLFERQCSRLGLQHLRGEMPDPTPPSDPIEPGYQFGLGF